MMFNPDTPIAWPSDDRLGRAALAARLATVIAAPDDEAGFVVGIHGESGAGKTSLLQMVQSTLRSRVNVSVVTFNPWLLDAHQGPLILPFFETMSGAFKFEMRPERRRLGKLLGDYGACRHAQGETPSARTADNLRVQIDEALHEAALRIVVFMDDIDKLRRAEMSAVFRLMKLVANFTRTTFVLACDPVRVAATLDGQHRDNDWSDGAGFLEKVVQVPITLPLPDNASLRHLALTAVDDACSAAEMELTADQVARFRERFDRALLNVVRTPRRARRYANALALSLPLCEGDDTAIVDHLCLEGLRVLVPDAYRLVRHGMDDVLGSEASDRETGVSTRETFARRFPELESDARSGVWWLLTQICPRLDSNSRDGVRANVSEHAWTHERRLAADGHREQSALRDSASAWMVPESEDLNGRGCEPQD